MYQGCGQRYYYRYVMGMVVKPTGALTLGGTVHQAVANNMSQKLETMKDLPEQDVLDYFSTVFDLEKTGTRWLDGEKPGKMKDVGVKLVALHHKEIAPGIQPAQVEKGFLLTLTAPAPKPDDEPIVYPEIEGWIDLVDHEGTLIETKTIGSKPKSVAPEHRLQTTIYTIGLRASGEGTTKARVDYLVKNKVPVVVQHEYTVTTADMVYFRSLLDRVVEGITKEIFIPNRNTWKCNKRWCGYHAECARDLGGTISD